MAGNTYCNYEVVIPSKGRSSNMPHMLRLFPKAHVYVDIAEKADYEKHVPPEQLFLHPGLNQQQLIMNYAMDRETAEGLLFCDDDLVSVHSLVNTWPRKNREARYESAAEMQELLENMLNMLCNLGLHLGGWNMQPHPLAYTNCEPFSLSRMIQGAFLLRGRKYRFDESTDHFDADINLNVLLKDRIVLKDLRFYWNFGVASGNVGGQQSKMTAEVWAQQRAYMQTKWGKYFQPGGLSIAAKAAGNAGGAQEAFGISVTRRSPLASRR